MCGIVGALSFQGSSFDITPPYLIKMRDTMVHRGPDGEGIWISPDKRVGFGHRRLSIIDLSEKASQPMSNQDSSIWITFNGEIYNHTSIKKELIDLGRVNWKTDHSDTEVVLQAFEQWGINCLHKFRGMFAFAIWDNKRKELWLVRDRIGIKPLYYSIHNNRITFASEIKALLQDPNQKRKVNEEALYHYLSFLTSPAPHTLFEGIKKLQPGTYVKFSTKGIIEENKYWDVWDYTKPYTINDENQIAHEILDELIKAVNIRKVSDVPVGVFLSGGIDSSTNAALFSQSEEKPIKTFSIGYQGNYESYKNELHYAKKMATVVGAEYHEKVLTVDDLLSFLPKMVQLQDEPIADPVCVPVYYVSKLARDNGVIVCQVGEGADELFWGYPSWKTSLKIQNLDDLPFPNFMKSMGTYSLKTLGKVNGYKYEWLRRSSLKQPIFWGGAEAFLETQKKRVISNRLRKKFISFSSWEALAPIYKRFKESAWETSNLNWMSYLDLNLRLPELLLMRVDKMSMGVSLEGRVPFLDHSFVERAMSIPEKVKTKNGILKYILKKAVRGIIPDELIDRKKQGFGVPIYEWFFGQLGKKTQTILNEFCDQTDYLNKEEVNNLIKCGDGPKVWYLLNFALWWKEYIKC